MYTFSFLRGICTEAKLLGPMVGLPEKLLDCFLSLYVPTSTIREFQFLHSSRAGACLLDYSRLRRV